MIVSLERMFRQLDDLGQDPEDSRFGDLSDVVVKNLKWVLEESFEWEARHKTGCDIYERQSSRSDYRNGYRYRDILTRFGRLEDVKVPRLRHSGFVPSILSPGRLALPDVEELVAKCLLCGASRTEVTEMLTCVLGYPPSGSLNARVEKQINKYATEFRTRRLTKQYRYLFIDGIWVKVKDGNRCSDRVVLVALAVDENGCKDVIGYCRSQKESAAAWTRLLTDLIARGLDADKLDLVISDDSAAIARAVEDVFGDIDHQLCWAHRMCNIFKKVKPEDRKECIAGARLIYQAKNRTAALVAFREWKSRWRAEYPALVADMDKDLGKLLAFFSRPESHWKYLRTSNPIERLNRDIRARSHGWAGFQNKDSCDRLLFGVFYQANNRWKDTPVI
jgi:transposase-like protein